MELAHQEAVKALKMVSSIEFSYFTVLLALHQPWYVVPALPLTVHFWSLSSFIQEHDKRVTEMREEFEQLATG